MAIAVHVCKIKRDTSGDERIHPKTSVANSADSPTVEDFIEDEAGDGYLPVYIGDEFIVMGKVADINAS